MNIHEYQAKELFRKHDIPVPLGHMVADANDAVDKASSLNGYPVVVKAQIHAGGRGKGGGVKLAKNEEEVRLLAQDMLGMNLVTHQTGPEGKVVNKLLIEQGLNISNELYFSILPDRSSAEIVMIASTEGGMDIEQVAVESPEKLVTVLVDPVVDNVRRAEQLLDTMLEYQEAYLSYLQ